MVDWIKKYKYAILVMLLGVVLMCLPGKSGGEAEKTPTVQTQQHKTMEEKLEAVLSQLQGAGKVKVMLTELEGERRVYQYDEDFTCSDTTTSERKDTVIITDSDRNEQAVITQIMPPVYLGAVILCQGADNSAVKLSVVEAVCKLTGLGADKICVLKMK